MIGITNIYKQKWTLIQTVMGSTVVQLPDNWQELLCLIRHTTGNQNAATIYVPRMLVDTTIRAYVCGATFTSSDSDNVGLGVKFPTFLSVQLMWGYFSNSGDTGNTRCSYYVKF